MHDSKRILLVDDDLTIVWGLGRYLARKGWELTTCGDGVEAIDLLETCQFNALITDIQMPKLNGIALVDWTKSNRPTMIVVVVTAFGSASIRKICLEKGASHYFEKPVDPVLIESILSVAHRENSFSGSVFDIDIFDYLQMLLVSRRKIVLELQSSESEIGKFYIDTGNIVHAECGDLSGENAVVHCLSFRGGTFFSLPWEEPHRHSINARGDFVLMDAAREKDEISFADPTICPQQSNPEMSDDIEIEFNVRHSMFPPVPSDDLTPHENQTNNNNGNKELA